VRGVFLAALLTALWLSTAAGGATGAPASRCGLHADANGAGVKDETWAHGISCQSVRILLNHPGTIEKKGFYCARTVLICWRGSPLISYLSRARVSFAAVPVVDSSTAPTLPAAAIEIANRQEHGQGYATKSWSVHCSSRTDEFLPGVPTSTCSLAGKGNSCSATEQLYRPSPGRVEALLSVDASC
jgi:hypothetical protein